MGIKLKEESEEKLLTIQGQRKSSTESSQLASKFSKTISLDHTVDTAKLTASLKNGVLVISAPKQVKMLEKNIRQIPITDSIKTYDKKSTTTHNNSKEKKVERNQEVSVPTANQKENDE